MTSQSRFSPEQLEKIRQTLLDGLGEDSVAIVANLENRFGRAAEQSHAEEKSFDYDDDGPGPASGGKIRDPARTNVLGIVEEGNPEKMIRALPTVRGDISATRALIGGILQQGKGFHMVEALSHVKDDVQCVDALVQGIVAKKGVNPAIDALKFAGCSPKAMKLLALAISDQGTINHIIRAVATAPASPEAEMVWSMELIGKGTVEQMIEAMNLYKKDSDGVIILATGVVSSKDVTMEQLVRAMTIGKDNPKASAMIAVELARRADISALSTILEKYVSDTSDAGEIVVAKLVQKGRVNQLVSACKCMSKESPVARMLAAGIVKRGTIEELERSYKMLSTNPMAQKIVGLEIVRKKGKIMALGFLGGDVWDLMKNEAEIDAFARKARARQEWVLKNVLKEELIERPPR